MAGRTRRRWLIPEVVQTSNMDCGPAALKSLLEGFDIHVSYGRLREACQTDVDGTSIDVLEDIANQLGLEAEQVLMPAEHVLIPDADALPAIAILRRRASLAHFVVIWRRVGSMVQIMDPAGGRRWLSCRQLTSELMRHSMRLPMTWWHDVSHSQEFLDSLSRRLRALRFRSPDALIASARAETSGLACLDAATRMVESFTNSGALKLGAESTQLCSQLFEAALASGADAIPESYWSARPLEEGAEEGEDDEPLAMVTGTVLVRIVARRGTSEDFAGGDGDDGDGDDGDHGDHGDEGIEHELPPELQAALTEPPIRPVKELWSTLKQDGVLTIHTLITAILLAGMALVIETILFRGLLELGRYFGPFYHRLLAVLATIIFLSCILGLQYPIIRGVFGLGRRLEGRLRQAFLEKIPKLGDRWFHSRTTADMAARSHMVYQIGMLPVIGRELLQTSIQIVATTIGLMLLAPDEALIALIAGIVCFAFPLFTQTLLYEHEMRVAEHGAGLRSYALDALLGLIPIRSHGLERVIRRGHEEHLGQWARSSHALGRATTAVEAAQAISVYALALWLLSRYVISTGDGGGALLVIFWALGLPALSQRLGQAARTYPWIRSLTLRLLEPLGSLEERPEAGEGIDAHGAQPAHAVEIEMENVTAVSAGHLVLDTIDLTIQRGEHVAIVGPSGAGKSTLVGLLLGWHTPSTGDIRVDGQPLRGRHLDALRNVTAWVDPAVQIWNRSLIENLRYGTADSEHAAVVEVIDAADMMTLVQSLPDGLQTRLGEGGGLVSGGEGQRVRLGRALYRRDARMVILDEPFRGLDRDQRKRLLHQARQWWTHATLLCITHDIGDVLDFPRVLVIERGEIREDGNPQELACRESRFREMLRAESHIHEMMWRDANWRRLTLGSRKT